MNFSKIYAKLIVGHPVLVIFISLILFGLSTYGSGLVQNESMDYQDMLPKDNPVISASNYFSDAFGGSDSVKIAIMLDPVEINSDEPSSVMDPRVITYSESLAGYLRSTSTNFETVETAGDILKMMNGGILPKSEVETTSFKSQNSLLSNYISDDNEMLIINMRLNPSYVAEDVVADLDEAIINVRQPSGVTAVGAGNEIADSYVMSKLSDDMSRTGMYSMIGIVLILIFTFLSVKYAILPLVTIIVGVTWTFGFIGFAGIGMTSATSGVLSMIMGIGIDFGIQIINRFRQEREDSNIDDSMRITLTHNLYPMLTTTLAAIIGFQAMGLGQLSFMKDMGNMMMYGVIFCFLAAITIVPALTIVIEKVFSQVRLKKGNKVYKIK